jgi:hypothetical protein
VAGQRHPDRPVLVGPPLDPAALLMPAGDRIPGESLECRDCHRIGTRGFTGSGDYGWVCTNDRACRQRVATRRRNDRAGWEQIAHALAERLQHHASCPDHPLRSAQGDCPFCRDRAAYRAYRIAAGLPPDRPRDTGTYVELHQIPRSEPEVPR